MRRKTSRHAFTLVELMVATGIMIVLGLMLITSLTTTVKVVNTGASRGEAWVHAQSILARVEDDLGQLHASDLDGRLVAGQDQNGFPFLVFTRALPEERTYAHGIFAGRKPNDTTRSDAYSRNWHGRTGASSYRAPGGVAALAYVFRSDNDQTSLYRGIMAPIGRSRAEGKTNGIAGGGGADLFDDFQQWHLQRSRDGASYPAGAAFGATFNHFASDVLFLGIEFLDDQLSTAAGEPIWRYHWDSKSRNDLPDAIARSRSWPAEARDQRLERALINSRVNAPENENAAFYWKLPRGLGMGFPSAARISVTVAQGMPLDADSTLASQISKTDTTIRLNDAARFSQSLDPGQNVVLIGSEWIRFGAIAGNELTECVRGVRGSKATSHDAGTRARQGLTLTKTLRLPQS